MYSRREAKYIKDTISHTVASTSAGSIDSKTLNSTTIGSLTGKVFGEHFEVSIRCDTGEIHIGPYISTTPLTTDIGYAMREGDVVNAKVHNALSVMGDSTTASFTAIIWGYRAV
jgi:hypothetical protein